MCRGREKVGPKWARTAKDENSRVVEVTHLASVISSTLTFENAKSTLFLRVSYGL